MSEFYVYILASRYRGTQCLDSPSDIRSIRSFIASVFLQFSRLRRNAFALHRVRDTG